MPILYVAAESDRKQLHPFGGPDYMDELQDEFHLKRDHDSRYQVLLCEALRQCRAEVDPGRVGAWAVANETEQRWLVDALTALNQALQVRGWPWPETPPDPDLWLLYFRRDPVVSVDPKAGSIDLLDYHEWVTGKCRICGTTTVGIDWDRYDSLTAADLERLDEAAAKGEWWCDGCYSNRCDDCGEKLRAPGDDECCEACRRDRENSEASVG